MSNTNGGKIYIFIYLFSEDDEECVLGFIYSSNYKMVQISSRMLKMMILIIWLVVFYWKLMYFANILETHETLMCLEESMTNFD